MNVNDFLSLLKKTRKMRGRLNREKDFYLFFIYLLTTNTCQVCRKQLNILILFLFSFELETIATHAACVIKGISRYPNILKISLKIIESFYCSGCL